MNECEIVVDRIVAGLESGRSGAVREAIAEHAPGCARCREHEGRLRVLARGLDPEIDVTSAGFVGRVMAEIRGGEIHRGAYDRLPPLWQIAAAGALFVALAAVVLAGGGTESWAHRALTGFLDNSLGFLGGLSTGLRGLWDAVVPGKGLPVLVGCAVLATILNVAFAIQAFQRADRASSETQ